MMYLLYKLLIVHYNSLELYIFNLLMLNLLIKKQLKERRSKLHYLGIG
jgi:hypothetical protein